MNNSPKILYIDDEEDLLDLASSFFEDENLPIDICTDFDSALALIRNNHYDLIISDANMPTGSGYDLFSIGKSEGHIKGKFILVTGNIQSIGESKHEFDKILYKPIRFEDLVGEVKKLLSL